MCTTATIRLKINSSIKNGIRTPFVALTRSLYDDARMMFPPVFHTPHRLATSENVKITPTIADKMNNSIRKNVMACLLVKVESIPLLLRQGKERVKNSS